MKIEIDKKKIIEGEMQKDQMSKGDEALAGVDWQKWNDERQGEFFDELKSLRTKLEIYEKALAEVIKEDRIRGFPLPHEWMNMVKRIEAILGSVGGV